MSLSDLTPKPPFVWPAIKATGEANPLSPDFTPAVSVTPDPFSDAALGERPAHNVEMNRRQYEDEMNDAGRGHLLGGWFE